MLETQGYKYTLRICNTYCFSTARVVTWTHPNVTWYLHCLSCTIKTPRMTPNLFPPSPVQEAQRGLLIWVNKRMPEADHWPRLVPKLRKSGAKPPLPHKSSCCVYGQISHRNLLPAFFTVVGKCSLAADGPRLARRWYVVEVTCCGFPWEATRPLAEFNCFIHESSKCTRMMSVRIIDTEIRFLWRKPTRCTISQIYLIKYSICFGNVHCPSSGVSRHCIHAIGICHSSSVGCLLAWSGSWPR